MFYKPIVAEIKKVPVIIYPCPGIEANFSRQKPGVLEDYLRQQILGKYGPGASTDLFRLAILWDKGGIKYVDIWPFEKPDRTWKLSKWGSGPKWSVDVYKEAEICVTEGSGCANSLELGHLEMAQLKTSISLEDFLKGSRPVLPEHLTNGQEFYIPAN
jgi:hypothetical protein